MQPRSLSVLGPSHWFDHDAPLVGQCLRTFWLHLAEKRQGSIGAAPRDQAYVVEGESAEQVG